MNAAETLQQARVHFEAGRLDDAMAAARRVLALEAENIDAMLLTARILRRGGGYESAASLYAVILEHVPDSSEAHGGIGACYGVLGKYSEALPHLRQAVALNPDYFEAWSFLAEALVEQGRIGEAIDGFERSLAIRPYNPTAISKYLFYAVFDPRFDARRLFEMNRDWGARVAAQVPAISARPDAHDARPLRIGYLSDEFYERVTARFMVPVLDRHDRARFHIACYARNAIRDATTESLAARVDLWRDLSGLDDRAAASAIRADAVDILVICTSYRAETRAILAYRPAPVQVCYSNLVTTTGLPTVDYLLTETLTDPPGSESVYTEALVRLTNRNIYQPPAGNPDPGPPPCLEAGQVTFASFNNLGKVTPAVVALWSRVLGAVPGSRLVMKSVNRFSDPGAREYFQGLFAGHGVGADRLELLTGGDDLQTHLTRYRAVDIALDPFPCNGGTTSCEALWMGVPVVTMAGETFMGRQGVNYLTKLGLEDLIARNADDYVAAAARLAADSERLASLRATLRGRVGERLFDPVSHVRELETAYGEMWRRFTAGAAPAPFGVSDNRVLA
jgi:predicted O-linked N-acetylglucosamine transferase (SPINDLY family)